MESNRRQYLQDKSMKDAVLAQLAGLSEKTIQRWVKNDAKDKVSETSHKKICTALEVQEYFLAPQKNLWVIFGSGRSPIA